MFYKIKKSYFKDEVLIGIKTSYFKNPYNDKLCSYNFQKGKRAGTICDIKSIDGSDYCKKHQKESLKVNTILKLMRHPKIGCLFDPKTKLVFESDTNKVVIGIIKNNIISDDYDIDLCKKNGFRFNKKVTTTTFLEDLMKNGITYIDKVSEKNLFDTISNYI